MMSKQYVRSLVLLGYLTIGPMLCGDQPDPVHQAVATKNPAALAAVLASSSASLEVFDEEGYLPLHHAARDGNLPMVKLLVEHGADIQAGTKGRSSRGMSVIGGFTALHLAAGEERDEVVEFLLQHGASHQARTGGSRWYPLHWAASKGALRSVKLLLKHGANVHACDLAGQTALFSAIECRDVNLVRCLLEAGANVNHNGNGPYTPLMAAAGSRDMQIVKALVEAGADLEGHSNPRYGSQPPLHRALMHCFDDMALYLLARGARADRPDHVGDTPLHYAVRGNRLIIAEALIKAKVDLNASNKAGNTPLHLACRNSNLKEMRKLLSDSGADWRRKNGQGKTPEDLLPPPKGILDRFRRLFF